MVVANPHWFVEGRPYMEVVNVPGVAIKLVVAAFPVHQTGRETVTSTVVYLVPAVILIETHA